MLNSVPFNQSNMEHLLDSANLSNLISDSKLLDTVNVVIFTRLELILPSMLIIAMVMLAFIEFRVKLDAQALRFLLNKDRNSARKVLVINFAQIVLMLSIVHLNQTTAEQRALSLYILIMKLVQTRQRQIVIDFPGIMTSAIFLCLSRDQSSFSLIESVDSFVSEVTLVLIPSMMSSFMVLLLPLIIPLTLISLTLSVVGAVIWLIVQLRRKYPDDFDFFVTVAICVLAWKILKKELIQRQVKKLVCSKLPSRRMLSAITASSSSPGLYDPAGFERVMKWCEADTAPQVFLPGHYKSLRDLEKPENMTYLNFYLDLSTNYRMTNIFHSETVNEGCLLTISTSPSESGMRGIWRSALYRLYLLASWIIPETYQHHLSLFGFPRSLMMVKCECDCQQLPGQIILERIN